VPIYEYRCEDCGKKSQFLTLAVGAALDLKCPKCGGARLRKLVSRVAVLKSGGSRLNDLADPSSMAGLDESDPKSVARWMKKMGREMGEDIGDDFEAEIDRAVEDSENGPEGGEGALPEAAGEDE
jgi:putative FmdB family regulatory protein